MAGKKKRSANGLRIIPFPFGKSVLKLPESRARYDTLAACGKGIVALEKRIFEAKSILDRTKLQIKLHGKKIEWNSDAIAFFRRILKEPVIRQAGKTRARIAARIRDLRKAIEEERAEMAALERRLSLLKKNL
ncbi:MAG: hypothetical protein WC634_00215 [archaeon]